MSALFRECVDAAGILVKATDGAAVIYLKELGGDGFHGEVKLRRGVWGERAAIHIENVSPNVILAMLRAAEAEMEREAVENDRSTFDHDCEPGRNDARPSEGP